jgi:pyruvate/2-oxoglutarate dehydrogenase complex dihydrolipoamide acyltransferase (E2) component
VTTDVRFPALSTEQPEAEGVVSTWFARDGEQVAAGQLVAEVMVDKVSADVESPAAGVIRLIVAEEAIVRQGDVIAHVE